MQINNNTPFLNSINLNKEKEDKELNKIGSGDQLELDDAAMVSIANALMSDANVLSQGAQNVNNGVSMMQIADGALQNMSEMATNLEALNVASNNAGLSSTQRDALQSEFNSNVDSMKQSMQSATFNGNSLFGRDASLSIGSGDIDISIPNVELDGVEMSSAQSIEGLRDSINSAISSVGSTTSALTSAGDNLYATINSTTAAYSQIADTDMAESVMKFKNSDLLLNASTIALAQKNELDQNRVLSLIA
ncbi:MAG: flagellin [Campylobacterota bacterium]|nr:flagellin [Campylobacterota bacterium]